MKKLIKTSFIIGALFTMLSFASVSESDFTGVYGVSENDPTNIELVLNKDQTFTYKDFSNLTKKIDVTGNWELKNKHIVLKNYTSEFSFHTKWKITKEGMIAKSRKGITFYTLVKK